MENLKESLSRIKEDLNIFDKYKYEHDGNPLWSVLSALRGPDETGDFHTKLATTGIIRRAVFGDRNTYPNDEWYAGSGGCIVAKHDSEDLVKIRKNLGNGGVTWHFIRHAQKAFEALGLTWDKINTFEE